MFMQERHFFPLFYGEMGRNDAKAETPVLWPPHAKSWLTGKDSDAGRDWGQEEKGTTEDEMAGWHHWLDGYESEWTLGVGDGQGGLACSDWWGRQESDTTEWMNWTELMEKWRYNAIQELRVPDNSMLRQKYYNKQYPRDLNHLIHVRRQEEKSWPRNKEARH